MAFPFTLEQTLIGLFGFYGGIVVWYYFTRVVIPRYNVNTLKAARNLYSNAEGLKKTLADSQDKTDGDNAS